IALIKVAQALSHSLKREDDFIFRLGGEEFGMLYFIEHEKDAINIANQTKETIEQLQIIHEKNSASQYITVSIGLYLYDFSKKNITPNEIYLKTDKLLYKSKQNGRNQVSY
ncbi:MAG: GGDEF domain-containing protein, partial [Arcobacteraceae bacterium]